MTSSPSPMPAEMTDRCSPAVPELTPMACFVPTYLAVTASNSLIFGPMLRYEVSRTPITASRSSCVMSGDDIGICMSVSLTGIFVIQFTPDNYDYNGRLRLWYPPNGVFAWCRE